MGIKSGISKNHPLWAVPPNQLILESSYTNGFLEGSCFHTKGSTTCENRNIHNYYSVTKNQRIVENISLPQRFLSGEIFHLDSISFGRNGQPKTSFYPELLPSINKGDSEWVGSASDAEKNTKTATGSDNTNQSNTQTSTKRKPKQEKASKATAKTF